MPMPGRKSGNQDYRFSFQGQEKDDEIKGQGNSLNYEYRMHDPRIGRFFAVDPLAAKYPYNSTYAFSENRVIDGVELEGLEVILINPQEEPLIYFAGKDDAWDFKAFHIHAHANSGGFRDRSDDLLEKDDFISNAVGLETVLQKDAYYDIKKAFKEVVVVLHACNVAPAAKNMSSQSGYTIIAPTGFCRTEGATEVGTYQLSSEDATSDYDPLAEWNVYKQGVLVAVYRGDWDPSSDLDNFYDNMIYKKELLYEVTTASLNLRAGAGTSFEINGDPLNNGSTLTPTGNVENNWIEVINNDDGRQGWVLSTYVKPLIGKTESENEKKGN
jgi:RHS repeat-associated protein